MAPSLTQNFALFALLAAAGVNANPLPTPPPVTASPLPSPTCTTVLTSTISGLHGDFTPKIAKTIYTKTVTELSLVPCNGCALSITTQRAAVWAGYGPQQIITATTTARHATTTTLTVCAGDDHPHPTPPHPSHGQIPRQVTTRPPPRPTKPGKPTGTTTTVVFPRRT
jgi:hypothetical protein